MVKLSGVLITRNEEQNLAPALESLGFCDELLVVDSGSTDRTVEIARGMGARVEVKTPWPGFVAQRTAATSAAGNDWILALDADERVSPALRDEIQALQQGGFAHAAYRIPRVTRYLGRWIRCTDWYPDSQLRLFDRTKGDWQGGLVHESFRTRGSVGSLSGEIEHHPYRDVFHHVEKMNVYTSLWAEHAYAEGRRVGPLSGLPSSAWALFRNLVLKRGLWLGGVGITVSGLNSYYTFLKFAKLRDRARSGP
jgi:glycosyltransferase involved in cell wall biosynthesis